MKRGGQNFFGTRVDLRDTLGLFVDIDAGIDTTTGIVTWNFTSIDPATEQVPTDPGIGFLPPNVTAPEGDGFVTYYIRPRSGLPTGKRLNAQANIVFDTNTPIATPSIFHTTDASTPTSSVAPLPTIIDRLASCLKRLHYLSGQSTNDFFLTTLAVCSE